MLFEPVAHTLLDFIVLDWLLILVSHFTEFQRVHDDCVNRTMPKSYFCRNIVYCHMTVFLDELIHFRNMLVCDLLQCSTPQVICVLRESACSTSGPLTGTYSAPHKFFPFVDGFRDLLHLPLSKSAQHPAAPI
ncbi:hypothetical protein AVEN_102638-1 [Araneus ventricosus]|uniref:Uncharacterized protein n=1 Tax=Araneus ventricosus TaxID=182803 RepID=A0A4Y2BJ81_ARAVE|nr:hypothetical protein AVEN_102638-1 [Araneus ventricosus]